MATSAWAAWGCGAQGNGGQGRSWNGATKDQVAAIALRLCKQAGGQECRIVSCDPNVDTEAQANALWPPAASNTVRCSGGKC